MQNTLLALAIAVIVALVAALAGPLLIDWGSYRNVFEAQASRLIGLDVRVTGAIDARLLPSPRILLHDIEIGRGEERLRARALGLEFGLSPLMRGEWRATDMQLDAPEMTIGLDARGHVRAPALSLNFDPNALSIERLSVNDGKITLGDAANGANIVLDKVRFAGEMRSLLGPFQGAGAATAGGTEFPFRISTGRIGDDGTMRLHVSVDAAKLNVDTDGALSFAGGAPQFDGTLNMSRPAGIAAGSTQLTQPWRAGGKLKASATGALMQDIEFLYGSEEQGVKLTGTADFKFGARPRFDGVLSGRQVDLDRALGADMTPAGAIRALAETAGGAFNPAMPVQIDIGVDQVTLGGGNVLNLRGDISSNAQGWVLDHFEFRAPGMTQVKFSGGLATSGDAVAFSGLTDMNATDPKTFAAWLEGRGDQPSGDARPLHVRGDLTLGGARVALENFTAEFDRKPLTGHFGYVFATDDRRAQLDAALKADDLDLDAALAFTNGLLTGVQIGAPHDMTIALDIKHAVIAGMTGRDASARFKVDAEGLQLDRLAVADLGGAAFSASGRIDTGGRGPYGALTFDLEAQQTSALAALVAKFAPATPAPLMQALSRIGHSKLHATLDVANEASLPGATAKLVLAGELNSVHVDTQARVTGSWLDPRASDLRVDVMLDAPQADALLKLIGAQALSSGDGTGQLKLLADGKIDNDLQLDARLSTDRLLATSFNKGRISPTDGISARGNFQFMKYATPPPPAGSNQIRNATLTFNSPLVIAGRRLSFEAVSGSICGLQVQGKLSLETISPIKVDGSLTGGDANAFSLGACALGLSADSVWHWPAEPFVGFADLSGQIGLNGKDMKGAIRFAPGEFAIEDVAANYAGGALSGQFVLRNAGQGVAARAQFKLDGADAARLYPAAQVAGTLDAQADIEGAGDNPAALIGSLHGTGKVALDNGKFSGLDPRAFDAVIRAADGGMPLDANRVADATRKALDGGALEVKRTEADLAVNAGQVRLNNVTTHGSGADLTFSGNLDLSTGALNSRLFLTGVRQEAGARPEIYIGLKGPLGSVVRTADASQFAGWLTLRSVEKQSKQLESLQGGALPGARAPGKPPQSIGPQN